MLVPQVLAVDGPSVPVKKNNERIIEFPTWQIPSVYDKMTAYTQAIVMTYFQNVKNDINLADKGTFMLNNALS